MSQISTGRLVGALFLSAFVFYGVGALLVESVTTQPDVLAAVSNHPLRLSGGAFLMLLNSVVVAAIGVLVYRVLGNRSPMTASTYLVARAFEATVLAAGVVFILMLVPLAENGNDGESLSVALVAGNGIAFQIAMLGLGIGSVVMCRALLVSQLVPRFLALWGVAGYAVFALGAVLELFGIGVGMLLAIPGGLFEVALGLTLWARGFANPADSTARDGAPAGVLV